MSLYQVLKFVHVFAAIIAVGFNFSYIVWLVKGKMEKDHLLFSLRGIKFMDDRIANPCYGVALVTGFAMTYVAGYNILEVPWILYPLILFGIMGMLAFGIYSPTLKKQIKIVEEFGGDSSEYKSIEKRQMVIGGILFVLAVSVIAMMVIKPS
jgi:quinol-cytochrome oxidoreductase complex cytochrome b subunit